MEITIKTLDDKDLKLKSSASVLIKYKAQFGKDMLSDVFVLAESIDEVIIDQYGNIIMLPEQLNWEIFLNMIWVLAKNADDSIPPPEKFLDELEIDLAEYYIKIVELLIRSMGVNNSIKKKTNPIRMKKKKSRVK